MKSSWSTLLWLGDGFDSGINQIGRRVDIDGRKGLVIGATDLTIVVAWDSDPFIKKTIAQLKTYYYTKVGKYLQKRK